jgi:RNA polymerase sigma factor (sigma-70 family)
VGATNTTIAVQRFLDDLSGGGATADDPIVRALLARSVRRLHLLCSRVLHRSYPRLTKGPTYLDADDLLGAIVERLLKAMRSVKPRSIGEFFGLANKHVRWELNGLARRLDQSPDCAPFADDPVDTQPGADAGDAALLQRVLGAIEGIPDDERQAFELVRIQGLTHGEAAEVLGVAKKTIQRRLQRSVVLLAKALGDLGPRAATDGLAEAADAATPATD